MADMLGVKILLLTFAVAGSAELEDVNVITYEDLTAEAHRFSEPGAGHFSQFLFDPAREQILVGARDALFRLTTTELQKLEKAAWPAPAEKITTCLEKGQSEEDCHNYVKVLLPFGKKVFACGTNAFSPQCSWREMENINRVTDWSKGLAKCPYNPHANVTSLMSADGRYFTGTTLDFSGADAAIMRDFEGTYLRTSQYNSKWLNEPQFVGSFETEHHVYFLFREIAVEYINCGKRIYSRIARVCKNDVGGTTMLRDNWTTFLKARLNCSIPGEYPFYFDEIQSVTYLEDEGLVYATFQTPRNSIAGSAICSFNLTSVMAAFNGPYKHQKSVGTEWERKFTATTTGGHQNAQGQCQGANVVESSMYQLMDNSVLPTTQSPLYSRELERLTHITIDILPTKLHRETHILFVSNEENIIKKISLLPRTQKTCILEIWKPYSHDAVPILFLHLFKQTHSLYVGTETAIMKIPSEHCKRYKSRQGCLNAMDPYCGWNEMKEQCSSPPDHNPLSPYWQQAVTGCPVYTHPVAGGWSSWSEWAPCNQAGGSLESPDQCLCSSRKCDNPEPRHGGSYCEGISIQVTNCTLHGGWTAWSAWSACSESCGMAVKTRKRSCSNPSPAFGGRVCVGQDTQEMYCHSNPPCPTVTEPARDGGWSPWTAWSECTAKCGSGYRTRMRRCDNPTPRMGADCKGSPVEYEVCNTLACLDSKKLSAWTPWTQAENGTGKRFRFACRAPVDAGMIKVVLVKEEERTCQGGSCVRSGRSDPDDSWSEWSEWSECSQECGGGIQFRTRNCESSTDDCVGSPRMTRACNGHSCKGEWGCWTDWSPCSVSCGKGFRERSRVCLSNRDRKMETTGCNGPAVTKENCEMPPCDGEGWSPWSNCDINGRQNRTRECFDKSCMGAEMEFRSCDDISNEITGSAERVLESSATTQLFLCLLTFAAGLTLSAGVCYYWVKKRDYSIPSSPHYISKQNPYVTVPLRDVPTPKRTPSFKATLGNGGGQPATAPKIFAKGGNDYETATIKRNSHSLLNGHARTTTLEQDKFF